MPPSCSLRRFFAEMLRQSPRILSFYGSRLMVRRADGALLSAAVPPYPAMLYASAKGQRWEDAVRLCR